MAASLPELFANPATPGAESPIASLGAGGISTAPATGTVETWTTTGAAPADLQAATGRFHVLIDPLGSPEFAIVDASTASGTSWSFIRGADGTSTATHLAGAPIYHIASAAVLRLFAQKGSDGTVGGPLGSKLNPNLLSLVMGSRLVAFGHSWLQGGGTTHVDRQFITLLAGDLRSDLRDLGVGGAQAALDSNWGPLPPAWAPSTVYALNQIVQYGQANYRVSTAHTSGATFTAANFTELNSGSYGYGGWAWVLQNHVPWRTTNATGAPYTPSANFLPLIFTGLNDVIQHANDAGTPSNIFKEGLRTHLSRICASKSWEDTDASVAYAGATWQGTKLDTYKNSGSGYAPIPGNGATITVTLPTDFEGGTVALGFVVWPGSDGTLTLGGTAAGTYNGAAIGTGPTKALAGLAYNTGGVVPKRDGANGIVLRVTGLTSADAGKTITVAYSGGAGTTFSTPAAPTVSLVGTGNAVTYTYERVYRTYNGDTLPSATTSNANGPTTLSTTNYNQIAAGPQWPAGVEQEIIVRTVGGTSQGIVAVLNGGPVVVNDQTPSLSNAYAAKSANPLVGGAAFDYWQVESNTPATKIAVANIANLPAATMTAQGITSAQIATYNSAIAAIAAEFADATSQVVVIDVDSALGANAAYFVNNNVHPNDRGHAVVASTLRQALATWVSGFTDLERTYQSRVMRRVTARAVTTSPNAKGQQGGSRDWGVAGIYTLTSSWADIDSTNLALSIDAQPGDDLEVIVNGLWGNQAVNGLLDVATVDANGNVINYFSTLTSSPGLGGVAGWFGPASVFALIGGPYVYTVTAADLTSASFVWGVVNLRLRGTGNAKQLYGGNTGLNIQMQVKNLGARNTPGFNAS